MLAPSRAELKVVSGTSPIESFKQDQGSPGPTHAECLIQISPVLVNKFSVFSAH
ncbi:UNVERIFIED_CONTAM: hypothetical protein K2H54_026794, partial [Gekko kuhli]